MGKKFTIRGDGWLKRSNNCDLILETIILKAQQAFESVYTMESKISDVLRTQNLFFTGEQVLQANTDSLNKVFENWEQSVTTGAWLIPMQRNDKLKSDNMIHFNMN